eukprot:15326293-Ditylum_brightwellii.AAC.1
MNNLMKLTPNKKQLRKALGKPIEEEQQEETVPDHLDIQTQDSPFTKLIDIKLNIKCKQDHLGFVIHQYKDRSRGFIHDIMPISTASGLRSWKCKYSESYIAQVNQIPVFTKEDIEQKLSKVREGDSKKMPPIIHLVLAPDKHDQTWQ